ncbi:MAG: endonuclease domain-containing protein [Nitrospirae bacterium]|nr:endonuclease domain-containing protein [Nitrospirota bacterium]
MRRSGTDAEQRLWTHLRDRRLVGAKFRRQHPIGPFIVDFCSPEHGPVVALDGGQHAANASSDQRRTDFLSRLGFRVLRFWDHDLLANTDAVLEQIAESLTNPHPGPLPARERGSTKEGEA